MSILSSESSESIQILVFLLPGFLAAGLFQTLVSSQKPSGFDVIVRAFVFTFFVHLLAEPIVQMAQPIIQNKKSSEIYIAIILVFIAAVFGATAALIWNKDIFHKICRKINLTVLSSNYSTRYAAFSSNLKCYVIMHLKGERRLYGWPKHWPSRPNDNYYLIEEYSWLSDTEDDSNPTNLQNESSQQSRQILISESEVEMVEFIPIDTES